MNNPLNREEASATDAPLPLAINEAGKDREHPGHRRRDKQGDQRRYFLAINIPVTTGTISSQSEILKLSFNEAANSAILPGCVRGMRKTRYGKDNQRDHHRRYCRKHHIPDMGEQRGMRYGRG